MAMSGVIFDCDGVLVDSEPIAWDAWAALILRHTGRDPDSADGPALVGIDLRSSARYLVDRYRLPPIDVVIDEYQTELLDRYATDLESFDDVVRAVREILHRRRGGSLVETLTLAAAINAGLGVAG